MKRMFTVWIYISTYPPTMVCACFQFHKKKRLKINFLSPDNTFFETKNGVVQGFAATITR